jgi:rod shape-determining protein MreC
MVMGCVLLFNSNPYQHSLYLTSAGKIASSVYSTASNVTGYFHLRDINEDLQKRNTALELEILGLKGQLRAVSEKIYGDTLSVDTPLMNYNFIIAHVINNSIARARNYITIEKGYDDGVKSEMGVVDQNGVIGIVNEVGPHTARIISLLNPDLRLSCKVKGSDAFGSLVWDGKNPNEALLEELPRHVPFHEGDTIVTSGFSGVFPEGIQVGTILTRSKDDDDNFYTLRIKLLTDFSTLSTVRVIENMLSDELKQIETDAEPNNRNF